MFTRGKRFRSSLHYFILVMGRFQGLGLGLGVMIGAVTLP